MSPRHGLRAALAIAAGTIVLATAIPAGATTGQATDKRTVVTITSKGATWKPSIASLKLTTGKTVRVDVVNDDTQKHWFQLAKRKTKALSKGQSYVFYYTFDKIGTFDWQVGLGSVGSAAFHGSIKIGFPKHFS